MSKFKVGDRVICTKNSASHGDSSAYRKGEAYVVKSCSIGRISTELDSVGSTTNGWGDENFELIPVAEATAPLTIEAGKYYRTRDGRKVGPMRDYDGIDGYAWDGCGTGQFYNKVGKADDGSEYDLIAEWVDEPVAEQQEVEQPQAQKLTSADGSFGLDITNGVLTMNVATLPVAPAIVALIEDGKAKPAVAPKLHQSRDAALKEADRLAGKYLGQVFGVFELTSQTQKELNYDHEWQRLAANGSKISAIKEIRQLTGFGLKAAKDGVEDWLSRHVATLRNAA